MDISDIPYSSVLQLIIYGVYLSLWHVFNLGKTLVRKMVTKNVNIPYKQARIGRILFRCKRDEEEITRKEDFVTVDDGFIGLDELKKPNWTVYSYDKNSVIFVELPKPLTEYTIDKYPFVFVPVHNEAIRTAEIELNTFISLADELEVDYKPPTTLFYTNTARCASTLFGSMLQHDGYSYVIAEHHSLMNMSIGYAEGYWSMDEVEHLLPAMIKFIRKGISDDKLLVLKGASTEVKLVPFLTKLMPEMKHVFMFRKKGYDSVEKMLLRDPNQLLLARIYLYAPYLVRLLSYISCCEGPFYKELQPKSTKEFAMIVYGAPYYYYKKNIGCFDYDVVWHHDVINNTEDVLRPMFEKLDLPSELIEKAKECLKKDSQNETFLSQSALANIKNTEMTPETKEVMKNYAERFLMDDDISGLFN